MSITRSVVRNVTRSAVRDVVRGGDTPAPVLELATLIAAGDSLTDNSSSGDIILMESMWVWAAASSGYDYYILDDAGVAGETVQDIYSRFTTDVVNKNPDVVLYLGGANNIGKADTPQDILDVIVDTVELLPSTTPVLVGYVPQRSQTLGSMTPQEVIDKTNAVNAKIATINSVVSNAYPAGPYTAYDALPLEPDGDKGGTLDGLHTNAQGAYSTGGIVWAPILASIKPALSIDNQLMVNSELSGTGGNTRFGASGVIADDWRGTNGVYSVSEGVQEVTVSGGTFAVFDQIDVDISAFSGEIIQCSVEIEIVSGSLNLDQIVFRLRAGAGGADGNSFCTLNMDYFSTEIEGKFRMTTQPFDVGVIPEVDVLLTITPASTGSTTIKISNPKCYVI